MLSQLSQAQLEHEFCRDFDRELERANLSLTAIHGVLDRMGVATGNAAESTTAQRLSRLIFQQSKRKEERVQIGRNFDETPRWRFLAGIPLIYVPILLGIVPMILCVLLVRTHLRMVGACNLKSYWEDFVPSWVSHRYTRKNQIVSDKLIDKFKSLAFIAIDFHILNFTALSVVGVLQYSLLPPPSGLVKFNM